MVGVSRSDELIFSGADPGLIVNVDPGERHVQRSDNQVRWTRPKIRSWPSKFDRDSTPRSGSVCQCGGSRLARSNGMPDS